MNTNNFNLECKEYLDCLFAYVIYKKIIQRVTISGLYLIYSYTADECLSWVSWVETKPNGTITLCVHVAIDMWLYDSNTAILNDSYVLRVQRRFTFTHFIANYMSTASQSALFDQCWPSLVEICLICRCRSTCCICVTWICWMQNNNLEYTS